MIRISYALHILIGIISDKFMITFCSAHTTTDNGSNIIDCHDKQKHMIARVYNIHLHIA